MSRISGIQQLLQQQSLGNQGRQGQLMALLPQLIEAIASRQSQAFQRGTSNLVGIEQEGQRAKERSQARLGQSIQSGVDSLTSGLQARGQRKFEAGERRKDRTSRETEGKAGRDAAQKRAETRAKPKGDGDDEKKTAAMDALKDAMSNRPKGSDEELALSLLLKGRAAAEAGNFPLAEAYAFSIEFGASIEDSAATAGVKLPPPPPAPPPPPPPPPTPRGHEAGVLRGIGQGAASLAPLALGGLSDLLGKLGELTGITEHAPLSFEQEEANERERDAISLGIFPNDNRLPRGGGLAAERPPLANPIADRFSGAISNAGSRGPGGGPAGLSNQQALPAGVGDIKSIEELILEKLLRLRQQQQSPLSLQQRGP